MQNSYCDHRNFDSAFHCIYTVYLLRLSSFSLIGERISQQAIAQLIGDPRYLRFNVLIRKDAKV